MSTEEQYLPPEDEENTSQAAVNRFYRERGVDAEDLRYMLAWRDDRDFFPYSLRIRWPLKHDDDYLIVVKVATASGPRVLFHTGNHLLGALLTLPGRLRSGKANLKEDSFPPENYAEVWAAVHRRFG